MPGTRMQVRRWFQEQLKEKAMRTRTFIAGMLSLPINAVLFGSGAIAVLSVPGLNEHAKYLLPAVIVTGFLATVPLAWWMAPRLRTRQLYSETRHRA